MKIAVDIDGTIFNCHSLLYKYLIGFFATQSRSKKLTGKEFKINKNVHYKERLKLFSKIHNSKFYSAIDDSSKVINKLIENGNEVVVLSNRPVDVFSRNVIFNLLNKYNFNVSNLVLGCKNKAIYCAKKNIDYMIDDQIEVCKALDKENVKSICIDKNLKNKNNTSKNITILKDWIEIEDYFNKFQTKNNNTNITKDDYEMCKN